MAGSHFCDIGGFDDHNAKSNTFSFTFQSGRSNSESATQTATVSLSILITITPTTPDWTGREHLFHGFGLFPSE
jgi:hypothetical protein